MTNQFIINVENRLQGSRTRLKELHFSAPNIEIHKVIDEFVEEFDAFDDELMENSQALWGTIEPGTLEPELPASDITEFESMLEELRGILVSIKKQAEDNMMWTGIINIVDGFWATINKYIYLYNLKKNA